ncbi:hypothetical protein B7494_g2907 [Chlorociboria aeruginascens]|nr:hypothetical protein B7494_g2907 [Chlorociboria aeruginascens]
MTWTLLEKQPSSTCVWYCSAVNVLVYTETHSSGVILVRGSDKSIRTLHPPLSCLQPQYIKSGRNRQCCGFDPPPRHSTLHTYKRTTMYSFQLKKISTSIFFARSLTIPQVENNIIPGEEATLVCGRSHVTFGKGLDFEIKILPWTVKEIYYDWVFISSPPVTSNKATTIEPRADSRKKSREDEKRTRTGGKRTRE